MIQSHPNSAKLTVSSRRQHLSSVHVTGERFTRNFLRSIGTMSMDGLWRCAASDGVEKKNEKRNKKRKREKNSVESSGISKHANLFDFKSVIMSFVNLTALAERRNVLPPASVRWSDCWVNTIISFDVTLFTLYSDKLSCMCEDGFAPTVYKYSRCLWDGLRSVGKGNRERE